MKKTYILLLSIFCLLLTACDPPYTDNGIILKAESLLNEHPDSAYQLLSGITKPEQLSKSDYAAWCLHYTHAPFPVAYKILHPMFGIWL